MFTTAFLQIYPVSLGFVFTEILRNRIDRNRNGFARFGFVWTGPLSRQSSPTQPSPAKQICRPPQICRPGRPVHPVVFTAVCCVFSTSWVCHSSCLSHFTPGPILQSCSPGLHLQSTPLHKPLDSLLSVPDRTTHYCVIRIPHSSSPASLLPRQPHPIPASSPRSINPFSFNSTSSPSALGFSIV
ncbi:unnamed protein product [Gadus morhua 'NCC']